MSTSLTYLTAYPEQIQTQVRQLLAQEKLAQYLLQKYPNAHTLRSDKDLYTYVLDLKNEHIKNADGIAKVAYDNKLHVIKNALGTHTYISRIQGGKLKAKHEIRIATLFKTAPAEFLNMIVVHELAHLKEKDHNKSFYQLCRYMQSDYHQVELDLRVYLTHLDHGGETLWSSGIR